MEKSTKLLQLCKGIANSDKESLISFIDNVPHHTLHQISEIFYNMQYHAHKVPSKIRRKLVCGMREQKNGCKYISKRTNLVSRKKKYLKKQVGNGLFTLIAAAAIPIITSIISAIKNRNKKNG